MTEAEPLTAEDIRARVPRRGSIPAAETLLRYAQVVLAGKPKQKAAMEMLKIAMTINHMSADIEELEDQWIAQSQEIKSQAFIISARDKRIAELDAQVASLRRQ